MKNFLLYFLMASTLLNFTNCEMQSGSEMANADQTGFSIEGNIENSDSLSVVLDSRHDGEWINIDSADIADGKFTVSGEIDHPQMVYLKFVKGDDVSTLAIFVENKAMKLEGDFEDSESIELKGSVSNDLYEKFAAGLDEYYEQYDTLYTIMKASENQNIKDSLLEMMDKVDKDSDVYIKQFVLDNTNSHVAAYLAGRYLTYGMEYDELQPIVASISESVKESKYVDELNVTLEKLKELAIGKVAPDFAQADEDGNAVELTSLRGKYVLVDFWASWCGPCRRENPNVVAMYNEFQGRDFEIIGVSLDKDKEKWLKAIEDDGLTWEHVSDLQGWKNEVADLYNVKAIPQTYLLDKDGTIIAKNLRGKELKDRIAELLNTES